MLTWKREKNQVLNFYKKASKNSSRNDSIKIWFDFQRIETKSIEVNAFHKKIIKNAIHSNWTDGHIRIYTDNKLQPMIEAFDPFVSDVKYLRYYEDSAFFDWIASTNLHFSYSHTSFATYQGASNEYLYNCVSDKTTVDTSNEIQKQPVAGPTNDLSRVSLDSKLHFNLIWIRTFENIRSSLENLNKMTNSERAKFDTSCSY